MCDTVLPRLYLVILTSPSPKRRTLHDQEGHDSLFNLMSLEVIALLATLFTND